MISLNEALKGPVLVSVLAAEVCLFGCVREGKPCSLAAFSPLQGADLF